MAPDVPANTKLMTLSSVPSQPMNGATPPAIAISPSGWSAFWRPMGATAMDLPPEKDPELIRQITAMLRMIIVGARTLAAG